MLERARVPCANAQNASNYGRTIAATEEQHMSLGMILLIVLVLALLGAIPTWPHSRNWGYAPSGGVGLLAVILIVLLVTGNI